MGSTPSSKRYVITNPPDDFPLIPTDMVFCLRPFEIIERVGTKRKRKKKREKSIPSHMDSLDRR